MRVSVPSIHPHSIALVVLAFSGVCAAIPPVNVGDVTATSAVVAVDAQGSVTFTWALASAPNAPLGSAVVDSGNPSVPAKFIVTGLSAGTQYVVRAAAGNDLSADSTFATPQLAGHPGLRFGVSGDWRGELAPYPAVSNADERGLALFVRFGDTIYADYPSPDVFMPQCFALDEYRLKHREVYSPRAGLDAWGDLALVTPCLSTIDDHEVTNDFAGGEFTTDPIFRAVPAAFEVTPFLDSDEGGNADADDPAIWHRPTDVTQSKVVAVAKNGGLRVYDLAGRVVQTIAPPDIRYNNVDLLEGVEFGGESVDIAVVTDRENDLMVFFRIDPVNGELTDVTDPASPSVFPEEDVREQETAYGVGTYTADDGEPYAFVSRRTNALVRQIHVLPGETTIGWEFARDIPLPDTFGDWVPENPQVEGIVADPFHDVVYFGQEQVGVWKTSADPRSAEEPTLIQRVREFDGPGGPGEFLSADVEGLAIADFGGGTGDLIVSSQGDSTFAIFDRVTNALVGRFTIGGGSIDAVEDCDGAAVSTDTFGGIWPGGLLVVQDGNDLPAVLAEDDGEIENIATTFKFLSYADVRAAATAPEIRVSESPLYVTGLAAFTEWNPIESLVWSGTNDPRMDGKPKLYRARQYAKDAAIFVLDARSFRDPELPSADPTNPLSVLAFLVASFDPSRTMLGKPQLELLKDDLLAAQEAGVVWKFVLMPEPIQNLGVVAASDRFEGYSAERTELLSFIDSAGIDNVVFVTADIHGTIINDVSYQTGPFQPQIPTGAWEISTGPVAFDAPFGPTVMGLAYALGLLPQDQYDAYLAAPTPVKDAIVGGLIDEQLSLLGYDPLGFERGELPVEFVQGGPVATHVYGWTEFDIAPGTETLTVTTYGIEPYTFADVMSDPFGIAARVPQIVNQLVVQAANLPCAVDFNGDGEVSAEDLAILLGAWDTNDAQADLDGSGTVDAADLAILLGSWGECG